MQQKQRKIVNIRANKLIFVFFICEKAYKQKNRRYLPLLERDIFLLCLVCGHLRKPRGLKRQLSGPNRQRARSRRITNQI